MDQHPQNLRQRLRKAIASFFVTLTIVSPLMIGGGVAVTTSIATPTPVYATAPTVVVESLPDKLRDIGALIKASLYFAARVGVKNAVRAFLETIAYNTAVLIASGGENQESLIHRLSVTEQLVYASDAAIGEFLNTIAQDNGLVELNLCSLNSLDKLRINLILPNILTEEPRACTFTEFMGMDLEITDSNNDGKIRYDDVGVGVSEAFSYSQLITDINAFFINFSSDPESYIALSAKFDEGDNALSAMLIAFDSAIGAEVTAKEEAILERFPTSFKGIEEKVSNRISTSGETIKAQLWAQVFANYQAELSMTGDPFADALSVFGRTLVSKYIERIQTGFLDGIVDINDSLAGDVSSTGSSGGRRVAEESFKSFKTGSFNEGGDVDILSEFASCPSEGASATNCVVDAALALAIEEGMTLREAYEQGVIEEGLAFGVEDASGSSISNPEEGIALRNIQILRAYNVVPVGWELAATYIRDFEDDRSYSIGEMTAAFDQCGEGDDYSPYCGLVDPDWVLKEPLVYCRFEGYGDTKLVDEFLDTDGNPYTPQENWINRDSSCLDPQTCIDEDDSGFCQAYGYCTEQYDIYRFQGDECPLRYTSCEGFNNADGEEVSYLQNTLNFNDCSENNEGCAWYCTVYNEVDEQFQCADQNEVYTSCDAEDGCSCTGSDGVDCTIVDGGFICTTDPDEDGDTADGVDCTLGTESETGTNLYSIDFDGDAQECTSDEENCTELIQVKGGNNLLANGDFESLAYAGTDYAEPGTADTSVLQDYTDTVSTTGYGDFMFGFEHDTGTGCTQGSPGIHDCFGWELKSGANNTVRGVDSPFGFTPTALQMQDGGGSATEFIMHRFETEQALENRSFAMSFYARASADDCTIDYWITDDDGTGNAASTTTTISLDGQDQNTEFVTDVYTFDPGVTDTIVNIGFYMPNGCVATIDGVKLEENRGTSGYGEYQQDTTYLNLNEANSCTAEEVGCELYTPQTGESRTEITGIVTNPLSTACGDGEDYTGATCSQCTSDTVGCDAFIEVASPYDAPLKDLTLFTSPSTVDADLQAAIADRTGYYCDNDFTACNSNADCSGSGQCLPSISVIPSTGTQCSADQVGCEEYVSIEDADAGGEELKYFSFIQKCVKPTERQNDAGETDTFFTWEGSDETGFQLRSWDLKVSTLETDEDGDGNDAYGPCTNLDLWDYTGTSESAEAECIDDSLGVDTCTYDGSDESCLEFRDADGNAFYRNVENIIKVSDQCIGLRNTTDDRLYYALQEDSTQCNAAANQCREYKGSQGSNVQILVEEDFESASFAEDGWDGGSASSETLTAGVSLISMLIGSDSALATGITETAQYEVGELLVEEDSYVVSFWAKGYEGTLDTLNVSLYSDDGATTTTYFDSDGAAITGDWKQYTLGPLSFEEGEYVSDETLRFDYSGSGVYIDYVELRRNDSHYLILDTAETCSGYEGCEQYQDSSRDTHYLKSFTSLCSEQSVGCEAVIATNESQNPHYATYNTDNEYDEDDVYVEADYVDFYTVVPEALCSEEEAGCMIAGLPDLDAYYDVESFEKTYRINDPDDYDTILCEQQSLYCEAYTTLDGNSSYYFKNPGDRNCEYSTSLGYWVIDGTESEACPVQYGEITDEGAQPKGPICNGGARAGQLCSHDDDCPAVEGDTDTYRCVSDYDDLTGWAGSCDDSYQGCTLYVDTNTRSELDNSDFETNVYDNDDYGADDADSLPDDWEILNEGESNASAGTVSAHTFRDVTAMTVTGQMSSDESIVAYIVDETVVGNSSGVASYAYFLFESDDFEDSALDVDDNPLTAKPMMLALLSGDGFSIADDLTITVSTTVGGVPDSVRIVIPSTVLNSLEYDNALFYVSADGALYWADEEGDGLEDFVTTTTDPILSDTEAFTNDPATAPTGTILNGFYDAAGYTGTIGCDTFEQSEEVSSNNKYSLKVGSDGTYETCMVASGERYDVDPDQWYTVRGNVYTEDADAEFSIGLHYFEYQEDVGYVELGSSTDPEGYAFTAYEGGDRTDVEIETNEWMHFHGTAGPNLKFEIPAAAEKVVPFVEVKSGTVYIDDIRLSENEKYSYLAGTVDGDAASNTNTCSGDIYEAGGCVAFRDATFIGSTGDTDITNLAYLSTIEDVELANSDVEIQSCTYNAEDDEERCSSYPNAADSNVVVNVRRDRGCAEWLTCEDSDPAYDDEGNITSDVCTNLARCTDRNPETGLCTHTVSSLSESLLSTTSDESVVSQPGNTDDIYKIGYLSGFSRAGIEWRGTEDEDSGDCLYGAYDGLSADENDCTASNVTYGYYPYDWMVEQGSGTASTTDESVDNGDFEEVYCTGRASYNTLDDLDSGLPSTSLSPVLRGRDTSMKCTVDYHCRTTDSDTSLETMLQSDETITDTTTIDSLPYEHGWCDNVDSSGEWENWEVGSSAEMMIIDYKFTQSFDPIDLFAQNLGLDGVRSPQDTGSQVGAGGIDLNNVLYVNPQSEKETGVTYEGVTDVYSGQEYVVTFDAAYTQESSVNDFVAVGLQHSTDLGITTTDYFTTGIPIIDIVFVLDASGSMGAEIANVASNISGFAEALVSGSTEEDELDTTVVEETYRYRFGILVTGDSNGTAPVDFDDYNESISTFSSSIYGSDDGVGEMFTEDVDLLESVLNHISSNLIGGTEHNYEALYALASGSLINDKSALSGYEIPYESSSQKFAILLTDELPESGDVFTQSDSVTGWQSEADEDYFEAVLLSATNSSNNYRLYSFLSDTPVSPDTIASTEAYDSITESLGGGDYYDLEATDYSPILGEIAGLIAEAADPFRFSDNEYKTYSLGPITIQEKVGDGDSTNLFIHQTATSAGTDFVIDNISLKPALEVNKEGNHAQDHAPNTVVRDCRGYPEEDSVECNYTDKSSGIIYTGWEGYCLVPDLWNKDRCVQWWPIDVIAASTNSFGNRQNPVEYQGAAPIYHCLAAKGNEATGACESTGSPCTSSSDCGSSNQCIGIEINTVDDTASVRSGGLESISGGFFGSSSSDRWNYEHDIDVGGYRIIHEISRLTLGNADDSHDDSVTTLNDRDPEEAGFYAFTGEEISVEQTVHISEIDNIKYNMGEPHYEHTGNDGDLEDRDQGWLMDKETWWSRSLETEHSSSDGLWYGDRNGNGSSFDPEDYDTFPNSAFAELGGSGNWEESVAWAWQYGWWCGSERGSNGVCHEDTMQTTNSSNDDYFYDADFVIVKGVTYTLDQKNITASGRVYNSGNPLNPFNDGDLLRIDQENSDGDKLWETGTSDNGTIGRIDATGWGPAVDNFWFEDSDAGNYLYWRGASNDLYTHKKCNSRSNCGANIMAVNFDFEDGYLDGVYIMYWDGLRRLDAQYIEDISWEFHLKEPCVFMVESVTDDADIVPWMTRVTSGSSYTVKDLGYTFTTSIDKSSNEYTYYGGVQTKDNSGQDIPPSEADGEGYDVNSGEYYDYTGASEYSPLQVDISATSPNDNNVLPFACIGQCTYTVCRSDYSGTNYYNSDCEADDDEDGAYPLYTGIYGLCKDSSGNNPSSGAVLCGGGSYGDDDCTDYGSYTCQAISGINDHQFTEGSSTWNADLYTAVAAGWERYRLIYPTLPSGARYFYLKDDSSSRSYLPTEAEYTEVTIGTGDADALDWFEFGDSSFNDAGDDGDGGNGYIGLLEEFQVMEACDDNERDDEDDYCGVRPVVSEISLDGDSEGTIYLNGPEEATLSFDLTADADQEPITNIYILWDSLYDTSTETYVEEFYEECRNDDSCLGRSTWDAEAESAINFEHLYTCDLNEHVAAGGETALNNEGETSCLYKLRIQTEDNWGWCSGNETTSGGLTTDDVRGTNASSSACESFDALEANIVVSE